MRILRSEDWEYVGDQGGFLIFKNRHYADDYIFCKACKFCDRASRSVEVKWALSKPSRDEQDHEHSIMVCLASS